jgi:hypothetical protein
VADFSMNANSIVRLKSESTALPLEVAIEPPFPIGDVFVGRRRISPTSRQFMLYQRDRHGMAWGDYNRDGFLDVFIVRGGLKGQLAQLGLVGQISDELMLSDGARFRDATTSSGLVKGACRGRGTMPVDVNRDGLLDLFWECHGSNPALYQSNPDGTFSDASTGLMRAGIRGEPLEWLDVNGDGRDELLKLGNNKLFVYRRAGKDRWRKREEVRTRGHDAPGRIAIADYDTDGDPDLFAPSSRGNTLLVNRSGHFDVRSLRSLGLPRSGTVTASWVDYDNDGETDLHASPQGIYRRVGARRFRRTGLAAAKTRGDGFASWFDFNNDGAQDLLLGAATPLWHVDLLENQVTANHWLQVELHGPGGEYPAAGATVTVKARGDKQMQWVGQNDGSHTSQGHYRLYFGLGAADAASVKVTWPDGEVQRIGGVGADQIVRITKSR